MTETTNDALKYVVKAKKLLDNLFDEKTLEEIRQLLEKAEETLVKAQ